MKKVTYHTEKHTAYITLNRPDSHNAFDDEMIARITKLCHRAAADDYVRSVVLQANGNTFCSGADLQWMQRMAQYDYETNMQDAQSLANMLETLNTLAKPTIAKVHGAAFGGAVGLVACCDIAIATKLSKFCLSEVRLGLAPATIMPYIIDAIGYRHARRYALSAEVISARRARRLGLIHEAVTESELDSTVAALCAQLHKGGPQAISATKGLLLECHQHEIDESLQHKTVATIAALRVGNEGQAGLAAFFAKTKPVWHEDK